MVEQGGKSGHVGLKCSAAFFGKNIDGGLGSFDRRYLEDFPAVSAIPCVRQYSITMNSTIEAKLRLSCSAAVTNAAFTSGGTRTLTISVLVMAKGKLLYAKR